MQSVSRGTTQDNLSLDKLLTFDFCIPPLPVQRRIAGILSAYDDLIENNLRRIRILEEMARSIYREWFVNFRFPGHEKVSVFDSALGRVPEGWELGRLDDAFVLQRGFDLPKPLRSHGQNPVYAATGVVDFHAETKARAPGVITGRSGTIGEIFYVQRDYWPLNTTLWVKEFRKAEPLLAYYILSMLDLKQFNSGAAVPTLNRNDIHGLPILIPPRKLQRQFQNVAGAMLSLAYTLELACGRLRQSRDLLLPRLLSGTIDVSNADFSSSPERDKKGTVVPTNPSQTRLTAVPISPGEFPRSAKGSSPAAEANADGLVLPHAEHKPDADDAQPPPIDQTDRSDVLAVVRHVFSDGQTRNRQDAIREVARALGYGRVGHRIQDVLHTALLTAVRRGILDNVEDELILLARSIAGYDRDFLKQQFLASIGRSWIERDDAIQNFCCWMGFRRIGKIIDETARSVIQGLLRESRLEADGPNLIRRSS